MLEMNADLMFASGPRQQPEQGELSSVADKSFLHKKFCLCRCSIRTHTIFDGDDARFVFAERRVNHPLLRRNVTVNDGDVFFLYGARLPNFSQFASSQNCFSDDHEPRSFAVETINQMRLGGGLQINPRATDEAGILVALRWVTDEVGRFVDDEQFVIFVNYDK